MRAIRQDRLENEGRRVPWCCRCGELMSPRSSCAAMRRPRDMCHASSCVSSPAVAVPFANAAAGLASDRVRDPLSARVLVNASDASLRRAARCHAQRFRCAFDAAEPSPVLDWLAAVIEDSWSLRNCKAHRLSSTYLQAGFDRPDARSIGEPPLLAKTVPSTSNRCVTVLSIAGRLDRTMQEAVIRHDPVRVARCAVS